MKNNINKLLTAAVLTVFLGINSHAGPTVYNLMPYPESLTAMDGRFAVTSSFTVTVQGEAGKRLYSQASRMLKRLDDKTGLFIKQRFVTPEDKNSAPQMLIKVTRHGKVALGEDESYSLKITLDNIELSAVTDIGAVRGIETLLQLLNGDENGYYFPVVEILDKPRFAWRGLLIDSCRHFLPLDVIKRNLDAMAAVKLNVLHWHLTEDQAFRIESKKFPKLHELGSDGLYYTQEQIKDIIKYADELGIRVVPEFDVPGHTSSWFIGYPELASAPGPYGMERRWIKADPTMNPTDNNVYKFLDKFLGEMAGLFPDEYLHIGGDEVTGLHWTNNKSIQEFMKKNSIKDNSGLQAYFNSKIAKILTGHGRKMVGWDDILHPDVPKNIVIQSYRGKEFLADAAKKGYMGLLSTGYYIDLVQPTDFHYLTDPLTPELKLSDEEKKRILGGEATMWSELVTPENIDSRIWPRTAAIAERLWSPEQMNDIEDMYKRLDTVSLKLEELGLTHEKNYEMMLRRLSAGRDIAALKILADVSEPIKIYDRHFSGMYNSLSPYTRFADACRPDAAAARNFRRDADAYLAGDAALLESLKARLSAWKDNHARLQDTIKNSPILKEIEPLSVNLSKISQAGLEALDVIASGKSAESAWVGERLKIADEAKKSYGHAELMIAAAVEKLIKAANRRETEDGKR